MVDQLSDGRLEAGFGRGYQPYEFDRLGVDFNEALPRLIEGMNLLSHLFVNPDQPFEGHYYKTNSLTITPAPRQLPHPPFWIAAGSAESIGFALDRGLSIVCNVGNNGPDLASRLVDTFHQECHKRAIDPKMVRFALQTHGYLVDSKDEVDTVVRSGGFLHRIQVRLREQRHQIILGINEASGHEKGEPTYAGWSSASLIGDREHIQKQVYRFAGLGISDLFVTMRFGEFKTLGTRQSMQAIAEAIKMSNTNLRKAS
jgi:alkanesulfonate monooxygenase SsuD/methylene tetrahydromethanopterin reductase-like flavin-dependent oxidoreductase (luciferase family)